MDLAVAAEEVLGKLEESRRSKGRTEHKWWKWHEEEVETKYVSDHGYHYICVIQSYSAAVSALASSALSSSPSA